MSPKSLEPNDFLPLSNLSFHVLLALGDGAAHGYAVGKDVEQRSGGKLKPTTGGLYQALKRLEEDGLIEQAPEEAERGSDARRQYFRLTDLGRRVAALEAHRLNELVAVARDKDLYRGSV
jgi:DNA-binding PadR family transcriptional regulator